MGVIFEPLTAQLMVIPAPLFPGTLVIASGKTFTVNNTLTLAGIDGTTMTFPTTSATLARTDAANVFTGTQGFSSAITNTQTVNATSSDGEVLTNTTAATVGAQQWSPRLRFTGQGWKTTATAASQTVDWIVENQPIQGTTNPTSNLVFSSQVNAAGYTSRAALNSAGSFTVASVKSPSGNLDLFNGTNFSTVRILESDGTVRMTLGLGLDIGGSSVFFSISSNGALLNSTGAIQWSSTSVTSGTKDLFLFRDGVGVLAQRNSTTAQKSRLYNTFTTVDTAGEWFKQDWITTANQFRFGAAKGSSTGTARVASWDYGGTEASPSAAISVPIASGSITFGGGLTLADPGDIVLGTTTGSKLGTSTTQKLGFYNATPVIQRADMSALIDSTTGTPGLTLGDVGVVFSQSAINNNFSSVLTQINNVRTALRDLGLMA